MAVKERKAEEEERKLARDREREKDGEGTRESLRENENGLIGGSG